MISTQEFSTVNLNNQVNPMDPLVCIYDAGGTRFHTELVYDPENMPGEDVMKCFVVSLNASRHDLRYEVYEIIASCDIPPGEISEINFLEAFSEYSAATTAADKFLEAAKEKMIEDVKEVCGENTDCLTNIEEKITSGGWMGFRAFASSVDKNFHVSCTYAMSTYKYFDEDRGFRGEETFFVVMQAKYNPQEWIAARILDEGDGCGLIEKVYGVFR